MTEALLTPRATLRIGRKRTLHLPRVLIEDNRVVIRTRCGLDPLPEGFTETFAIPTCDDCEAAS
jgi:hypothetical protein